MPRPHLPEFRQCAVELARLWEKPVARIAENLGISDSCLHTWMKQPDIDDGSRGRLSTDDHAELVALHHELRTTKMENEILRRTTACFAKKHVLSK
jgi:transposase-like protein